MIKRNYRNLIIIFTLILTTALSLAGCGDEPDPNEGVYKATVVESDGMTLNASMVFDEFNIELKTGGKGTTVINGKDTSVKWKRDGKNIEMNIDGDTITGTVENGVMYLPDFAGEEGMNITLECEALKGAASDTAGDPAAPDNAGKASEADASGDKESTDSKAPSDEQGIFGRYDAVAAIDSEGEVWLEEGEYLDIHEDGSVSMYVAEQSLEFDTTIKDNKFYLDGDTKVGVINDDGSVQLELNDEVSYIFARKGIEKWDEWRKLVDSHNSGGGEPDPQELIGHYDAVYIFDENQEQKETSGEWLELDPDGKATLYMNGGSKEFTYTVYGETEFYLTDEDNNDILGFYGDGWVHLSIDNMTLSMAKKDAVNTENAE
ncbi:MAG: hypothetical protein K5770_02665 [Lachnospiraceae bacterium]|nr:hypothetical protein [Lachnospiraceae bacterium]